MSDTKNNAPGAWAMVALLMATWIMAYIDRMILLLLVPGIKASFHVDDTSVALLYGFAFAVDFVIAGLIMGRLVDRVNRRNLLVGALVVWSIGAVVGGVAHSFALLLVARLLIGAAEAVLAPASFSLVADLFAMERRGRPVTLLIATSSFGSALSNILGGLLLQYFSHRPPIVLPLSGVIEPWQATMAIAGLPGFILAPLFLLVREPVRQRSLAADASNGSGLAYVRRHFRAFGPLFLAVGFAYIVGYGLSGWYPTLFMRVLGLSPAATGVSMGVNTIITALIAGLAGGWLSDRFARREPGGGRLKLAAIMLGVEFVALGSLSLVPHMFVLVFAGYSVFALVSTIIASCGYAALPDIVPNEIRGQVTAFVQLIANIGGLGLGPMLVALVTDQLLHDESKLAWSMLIVALPCIALSATFYVIAASRARALRDSLEGGPTIMHKA